MARGWQRPGLPVGTRFHQLTTIGERCMRQGTDGHTVYSYPCRCDCGKEVTLRNQDMGRTKSCGCLRGRNLVARNRRHGESTTRLYYVWHTMRQRCLRSSRPDSHRYFGRGITVCPAWDRDYLAFRDWALTHGYRQGLHLDRIDNDGPYAPENCRWVTNQRNACNRSDNVRIVAFGETRCLAEWARDPRCTVSDRTILYRIHRCGWTPEAAISLPRKTVDRWGRRHDHPIPRTTKETLDVTYG